MVGVNRFKFKCFICFGLMGLNVYGFVSAGWASNSKYSFLGAVRAAAQM